MARTSAPREHPETVAKMVAVILDAPPTEEEQNVPGVLLEVQRIRSGCRRILEANLSPRAEERLIRALGRVASRATLRELALEAMLRELVAAVGRQLGDLDDDPVPPVSFQYAQARMRRSGFDQCPACGSLILMEAQLAELSRRRRWAQEDAERWHGIAP